MHYIDLNASPLPDDDEQLYEIFLDYVQQPQVPTINDSPPNVVQQQTSDIMQYINLNASPLSDDDEQSYKEFMDYVQQPPTSSINTSLSNDIEQPIIEDKQDAGNYHCIDLNAPPLSEDDEQPIEDFLGHMEQSLEMMSTLTKSNSMSTKDLASFANTSSTSFADTPFNHYVPFSLLFGSNAPSDVPFCTPNPSHVSFGVPNSIFNEGSTSSIFSCARSSQLSRITQPSSCIVEKRWTLLSLLQGSHKSLQIVLPEELE